VIRAIQDTRKAAGLNVSDRITLSVVGASTADLEALSAFETTIASETLATEARFTVAENPETFAAVESAAGSQRTTLAAEQYANTGTLVIDVWKTGAVNV